MNRRDVIKLTGAAAWGLVPSAAASALQAHEGTAAPAERHSRTVEQHSGTVERWGIFEAAFNGPASGNPFVDAQLSAHFRHQNRVLRVSGFYDGRGVYRIRFMPDQPGEWSYTTESNVGALNNLSGTFQCSAASQGNHGPVEVNGGRHFSYADGTPFFPFGTTCYAWVHQTEALQQQTLKTLAAAPFTKIRMCVFPKSYEYNQNEPPLYPFPRKDGQNDLSTFNVDFFQHFERRIGDLNRLGIQADLILFHPYDRWGYASMPADANDRYLRYVVARFSAYRNVWWSLANEYDFIKSKTSADWDRFARIVQDEDAAHHLRSIHHGRVMYDYSRQWVTHASLQTDDFSKTKQWFMDWNKPIIFDECKYEGNIPSRWGNLSGEEMTRRFWLAVINGCYATHGETYLDPNDVLWWSKGGELHGTSPERIAFLRRIAEQSKGFGWTAVDNASYLSATSGGDAILLYYFDYHQLAEYEFKLPEGSSYKAELIDPWKMTITPVEGLHQAKAKLKLPGRPYQAVRFVKAE